MAVDALADELLLLGFDHLKDGTTLLPRRAAVLQALAALARDRSAWAGVRVGVPLSNACFHRHDSFKHAARIILRAPALRCLVLDSSRFGSTEGCWPCLHSGLSVVRCGGAVVQELHLEPWPTLPMGAKVWQHLLPDVLLLLQRSLDHVRALSLRDLSSLLKENAIFDDEGLDKRVRRSSQPVWEAVGAFLQDAVRSSAGYLRHLDVNSMWRMQSLPPATASGISLCHGLRSLHLPVGDAYAAPPSACPA